MTTQNLWGTAKAVLRGKIRLTQAFLKNPEKSQVNNLKQLKKNKQKPKLVVGKKS